MLQKSTYVILLLILLIGGTSAVFNSSIPPAGFTGTTPGFTCAFSGCHSDPNPTTGNVSVSGLPSIYTPGATYTFSLTITHGIPDRLRWGFSIAARKPSDANAALGTFSSSNPNAAINGTELSHLNAPVTLASGSYTFTNLHWTAPAFGNGQVKFYFAGNAANNNGLSTGDYIYTSTSLSTPLPVTLYSFNASIKNSNVLLSWQTAQEINSSHFVVERSYDNSQFISIGKVDASGNSSLTKNYSFTDEDVSQFEKPIYYRLGMLDKDGSKTYSNIENVVLKATGTYIKGIYPNPLKAGGTLHINFVSKNSELVLLKLIDNSGRLTKNIQLNAQKGSNLFDVRMPVSAAGNYKLILKSSTGTIKESLLIN